MYSLKKELDKELNKEEELVYYPRRDKKQEKAYNEYAKKLSKETDFEETEFSNYKKFNKKIAWKDVFKMFHAYEVMYGIITTLIMGYFSYGVIKYEYKEPTDSVSTNIEKNNKNTKELKVALFTTIVCLLWLIVLGVVAKHNAREKREENIDNVYNALSIRLFKQFRTIYTELDEYMLQKYNPKLVHIVSTLLIKNMDEKDTEKLRKIAIALTDKIREKKADIKEYNLRLNEALEIITKALNDNKNLYHVMALVFKGWVPTTFDLNNNDPKKMIWLVGNSNTK